MTDDSVVLGIDGGTTVVKTVAFDLDGSIVHVARASVPLERGPHGEAELDMDGFWTAVAATVRETAAAIGGRRIVAIGLTGQGDGAWLIDADGHPVRKAAIWLDGRAGQRTQVWEADGRAAAFLATTGTVLFAGLLPVLLEELTEAEPEAVARATTHLNCKDWLRFRLTGERLTDYTEASRSLLDVTTNAGYSAPLAATLGVPRLDELVPEIRSATAPGGVLSGQAAAELGLPAGIPVGVGMIDVAALGAGVGALGDDQGWVTLGTTGFVGVNLPSAAARRSADSAVLSLGRGQQVLEFLAPMTGAPNLDWGRAVLGLPDADWATVEQHARQARPGSEGVLYLPYGSPSGERAPFMDPRASASWHGLSITTTRAQLFRSMYEGVAFALVECVEILELKGDLIVSGGGFRSDLLCQIVADASGHRVLRQNDPEAAARGAATLALVSAGVAPDLEAATSQMIAPVSAFDPDPAASAVLGEAYRTFLDVRATVRPTWPALRALRASGS